MPARASRWRLRIRRRELRLGSGLVLLGYIAAHLLNHALGLVSVPLAERGLALGVAVWHSLPGSVLLYGGVAVHVSLALQAIYQRRSLRMPPLELLRMLLGLGIPLLLIGHVVHTRVAWELYDAAPRYARIVWGLWLSDGEARQLAMLVPGWLHGCLSVHFAFGRRGFYKRFHLPLFGLALLVPVPQDLVFAAQSFADTVCGTLRVNAAVIVEARADSVLAVFGLAGPLQQACRDALAAAHGVEHALGAVVARHAKAFGSAMECAVVVHAGHASVGPLSGNSMIVAGEALATLRKLQLAAGDAALTISAMTTLEGAGLAAQATVELGGVAVVAGPSRGRAAGVP